MLLLDTDKPKSNSGGGIYGPDVETRIQIKVSPDL